ncbi:MAG: MerR family transcriptional regulator [Myxococcales bacterium]|nr:MerR family transcriptional regulator [Myxococcales bacterium]
MSPRALPDKEWFRIGEVADLVGVRPHVLRHWERELPQLRPRKTRGAHRHYHRDHVTLALLIRELVYDRGFTLAGAKRALREREEREASKPARERELALRAELLEVRGRLAALLEELESTSAATGIFVSLPEPASSDVVVEVAASASRRR